MTELSDADREMAVKILEPWYGGEMASAQVDESPEDTSALLTTARTLVAAEILAAARISEDEMVEAMADRFMGWPLPSTVCSDLCATDSNYQFPRSGTNLLTVDEAQQMFRDALTAIKPTLARLAAENAALRDRLKVTTDWLDQPELSDASYTESPRFLIDATAHVDLNRAALGDHP